MSKWAALRSTIGEYLFPKSMRWVKNERPRSGRYFYEGYPPQGSQEIVPREELTDVDYRVGYADSLHSIRTDDVTRCKIPDDIRVYVLGINANHPAKLKREITRTRAPPHQGRARSAGETGRRARSWLRHPPRAHQGRQGPERGRAPQLDSRHDRRRPRGRRREEPDRAFVDASRTDLHQQRDFLRRRRDQLSTNQTTTSVPGTSRSKTSSSSTWRLSR